MIKGTIKTEKEYRALELDSSSSIKDFSVDRRKYFKKNFLGQAEADEDDDNKAIQMGRLVETLKFEPERFDEQFFLSTCSKKPTGKVLDFVNALYKRTKEATVDGVVTKTFGEISQQAYIDAECKKPTYPNMMLEFENSDAYLFYKELRDSGSKVVICGDDVDTAHRVIDGLESSPWIGPIINRVSTPEFEVINQLKIDEFDLMGLPCKAMLDRVHIDHINKTIQPYDLKCTWAVEHFYEQYFLFRRSYIQACVYDAAVSSKEFREAYGLEGYTILPIIFIVCDSINYYRPLLYQMTTEDIVDGWRGFSHKGRSYPGLTSIIGDLIWAKKEGIWDISRENYRRNGVIEINRLKQ